LQTQPLLDSGTTLLYHRPMGKKCRELSSPLKYKNYLGIVEYDSEGKIFTGEVLGSRDVITFQGCTPEELEDSFRQSIDFYLEMCARDKVSPEKSPFDVRSVKLPITKADILEAVRESRASGDRHA